MHKRSSTTWEDANRIGARIVDALDPEPKTKTVAYAMKKNPAAGALGRLGGVKGGKVRAQRLSPEERREIARKAAKARWKQAEE